MSLAHNLHERSDDRQEKEMLEAEELGPIVDSDPPKDISQQTLSPAARAKLLETVGVKAQSDNIAPSADVQMLLDQMMGLSQQEAIDVLVRAMEYHQSETDVCSCH